MKGTSDSRTEPRDVSAVSANAPGDRRDSARSSFSLPSATRNRTDASPMSRIATADASTATLDEGPATRKPRPAKRDVASIDRYSGPMSGKIGPGDGLIGVADLDRNAAIREKFAGRLN